MPGLKHITESDFIYFVTTTTHRRQKLFLDGNCAEIVIETLKGFKQQEFLELYAFVIMPDHLHLIFKPTGAPLPKIMKNLKGKSSRLLNRYRQAHGPIWQERYYEHVIRDEKDFQRKYQYILYNPVKAGLAKEPEDYLYSSACQNGFTDPVPFLIS